MDLDIIDLSFHELMRMIQTGEQRMVKKARYTRGHQF